MHNLRETLIGHWNGSNKEKCNTLQQNRFFTNTTLTLTQVQNEDLGMIGQPGIIGSATNKFILIIAPAKVIALNWLMSF